MTESSLEEEVVVVGVSRAAYVSVEQRRRAMMKMVVNLAILICKDAREKKNEILCEDEAMMNQIIIYRETRPS